MPLPSFIDLARALIASPSISSFNPDLDHSNQGVIELLEQWFSDLGFSVTTQVVDPVRHKVNLIATLGPPQGQGLVLAGHTDTVPCDASGWLTDPFTLAERDQRLYGLGSADMKLFFALIIIALRDLDPRQFRQSLTIVATADEESTMGGARALLREQLSGARFAVIGEPTELRPIRQHKGISMESIRLTGLSGHSSDPGLGRSALEGMHELMTAMLNWRQELQRQHYNPDFRVPVPTLNFGHIHGGDNPNRICGDCVLHFDLRPLPGMVTEQLRAALRERLAPIAARLGLTLEMAPLFAGIPPLLTAADSPIVQISESLSGHAAGAVNYGTEGPYLNQLGLDTVILGPGSIQQAHQPNEFLALSQIEPGVALIRRLIERFCLMEQTG